MMRALQPALLLCLTSLLLCLTSLPAGAADKRFLTFGDSITVGHGDGPLLCPNNTYTGGYLPRLEDRLLDRGLDAEILNFGVCGERTPDGVTRIDSVLAQGGDVIIIMEGTNDISRSYSLESILFNLNVMANKARSAGIEPLVTSVIPRQPGTAPDPNNTKAANLESQLRQDAAEQGWVYADQFHTFFNVPNFAGIYFNDPKHPNAAGYGLMSAAFVDPALEAAARANLCNEVPDGPCVASATVLCLNQGRFRLEAVWENFQGGAGVGQAVTQTDDTGAFYWFDPENIELVIKVLDGRGFNGHFWVFYGALSNVEFSLVVKDTETGQCREYFNPLGTFASIGDTTAFEILP